MAPKSKLPLVKQEQKILSYVRLWYQLELASTGRALQVTCFSIYIKRIKEQRRTCCMALHREWKIVPLKKVLAILLPVDVELYHHPPLLELIDIVLAQVLQCWTYMFPPPSTMVHCQCICILRNHTKGQRLIRDTLYHNWEKGSTSSLQHGRIKPLNGWKQRSQQEGEDALLWTPIKWRRKDDEATLT